MSRSGTALRRSISTLGADGGTRTRTTLLSLAPQASVSAIPPHPHRRPSRSWTSVSYGVLSPSYRDSHMSATYLCTDGVANHPRLLIDCSCLNKHPTIVWTRYLLRFLIFRQPFSAKLHIRFDGKGVAPHFTVLQFHNHLPLPGVV